MTVTGKHLFFFVGISGSGKDSIMRETARELSQRGYAVKILERWITRPPHSSESFKSVSKEKFLEAKSEGKFALEWYVYGKYYGCPKSLEDDLMDGKLVFVNVSRSVLYEAKEKYPESKIVLIQVSTDTAEKRIKNRKRENKQGTDERLTRMKKTIQMPSPDLVLYNEGKITEAVSKLMNFILTSE